MGESRRHCDEEFKRITVDLSYKSGKAVDQIAYDLGINGNILFGRRKERSEYGDMAFPSIGKRKHGTDQVRRIRRLKRRT